jgi:hypothetical protein
MYHVLVGSQSIFASFYQNDYGPSFLGALESFDTYRKEFQLGTDGWLTVSMSARDWNKDGTLEREPNVTIVDSSNGRRTLQLDASDDHTSGVILRNTNPLPDVYRIEYKLMTYDFGGKRNGNIEYDGKINGYKAEGPMYPCKTQVCTKFNDFVRSLLKYFENFVLTSFRCLSPPLTCSIHGERALLPKDGKAPLVLRIVNGKMCNAIYMDTTDLAFSPLPTFRILLLATITFGTSIERSSSTLLPNIRTE